MIEYADWINFMTYDLHGAWDATNPIGSVVQGHTNLTEIKLATELFWRAKIPPAKIVMGFAFYGRSFTLSDPSCTSVGCPFSGPANPGSCSATGGILEYYELQQILQNRSSSNQPIHDTDAAMMYYTFDKDQWVSYDNAVTFKQKIDWADSIGLGGALIWASDLDDDQYTAHTSLLGRNIKSTSSLQDTNNALSNPQSVIMDIAGSNGQNCFQYSGKCVNLNDNLAMSTACGPGFTVVGWDDAGCGKKNHHYGKPICCPTNAAPKDCMWRGDNNGKGSKGDCSEQCYPGEINIQGIASSWGGGFTNDGDTDKCTRGRKAFCCPGRDYTQATSGCQWAACGTSCAIGQVSVLSKLSDCFWGSRQYCCPVNTPLAACYWNNGSGAPDCANAICSATEVEIDRDEQGKAGVTGGFACNWGRKKAACCTVTQESARPATCSANLCLLLPGFCPKDDDDESANGFSKRALNFPTQNGTSEPNLLVERGNDKTYYPNLRGVVVIALAYPGPVQYLQAVQSIRSFFARVVGYCDGPTVEAIPIAPNSGPPRSAEVEHIIDRQIIVDFMESTVLGTLPGGRTTALTPVLIDFWQRNAFLADVPALANRPPIGGPNGAQPADPNSRIMECFGTRDNVYPLLLVDSTINGAKGRVMAGSSATSENNIDGLARRAIASGEEGHADTLLESIRVGFTVFDYLNTTQGTARWNNVRNQIRLQLTYLQQDLGIPITMFDLVAWWDAWFPAYMHNIEQIAQNWARNAINRLGTQFNDAMDAAVARGQPINANHEMVANQLAEWVLQDRWLSMTTPPWNNFPPPAPPGGAGGGGGGG